MSGSEEDPLLGALIGDRYRVEVELGRGGMGVVYRAEHVELGQQVALKVMTGETLTTTTAVDRFLREARTTASLGHPNIVRVQDLGKLDDGRPYLVMELLDGEGFDERLDRARVIAPEDLVPILDGAAAALDAIHSLGLVHRDVKPENLFIARAMDGAEVTKLVDFGLVGMSRPDVDEPRLTKTGLIYGTPQYMAPETMAEKVPSASWDIYALAVVVFEALTGEIPLRGDNPLECLTKRAMEEAPRLGDVSGRDFPEAIERVVRRGLSRFADARHDTAGELAAAFAEAVREEGGSARAGSTSTEARPPTMATADGVARPSVGTPLSPVHRDPATTTEAQMPSVVRRSLAPLIVGGVLAVGAAAAGAFWLSARPPEPTLPHLADAGAIDGADVGADAASDVGPDAERALSLTTDAAAADTVDAAASAMVTRRRSSSMTTAEREAAPTMAMAQSAAELGRLEREANRSLAIGDVAGARRRFVQVTEAAPRRAAAWRGLGVAAERLGRRREAVRAFRRYLALAPGAPDAAAVRSKLDRLEE